MFDRILNTPLLGIGRCNWDIISLNYYIRIVAPIYKSIINLGDCGSWCGVILRIEILHGPVFLSYYDILMLMLNLVENCEVWFWFPTHLKLSRMTPTRGCSMTHFNDGILLSSVGGASQMGGGISNKFRSSHPEVLDRKSVLKTFVKSIGKQTPAKTFFKKDVEEGRLLWKKVAIIGACKWILRNVTEQILYRASVTVCFSALISSEKWKTIVFRFYFTVAVSQYRKISWNLKSFSKFAVIFMSELQKNLKKSRSLETPVKFASNLGKRCLKPDVTLFYLLYLELDFAGSLLMVSNWVWLAIWVHFRSYW